MNASPFRGEPPSQIYSPSPPAQAPELGGPINAWVHGGCQPNPGAGGWAVILQDAEGREKELSGYELKTTNNRMELQAAIMALSALRRPCRITLHTASEYLTSGATLWLPVWRDARWRTSSGKALRNRDAWKQLHVAAEPHEVDWRWSRHHATDPITARARELAFMATRHAQSLASRLACPFPDDLA